MSESTTRRQPSSPIAVRRAVLTQDLQNKIAHLNELQRELESTKSDKRRLLPMIKDEAGAVEEAGKKLDSFENGVLLPHLKLTGITIWFHPNLREFDATVWVNNDGILPVLGSFELDLSVTFFTYGEDAPLQVNAVYPKTTPDSSDVQPGGTNPFLYPNIQFVTKPGSSSALYTFDVLLYAGPDGIVADQNLHVQFLLRPPLFPRPIIGPARA